MKIIKLTMAGIMSIALFSCQAQNKKVDMEKLIQAELALTQQYDHRPLFGAQLNKTACKMIIELDGSVDYRLTDNTGESMMLPLNAMILEAGKQQLKIRIYPKDGEQYLTKYTTASVTIYRSPDKDASMKEYKEVGSFELPANIEEEHLPYYEGYIEFEADVPYDYQKELDEAQDLSKIMDIETKIVHKYNELRDMAICMDENAYLFAWLHSFANYQNTTYSNTYEEIKKSYETKSGLVDSHPAISDREFLPIENYTMQFYANGKIVALWQRNHRPMLYMTALIKKGTSEERKFEGGDPIFLYMPKDSDELKIW